MLIKNLWLYHRQNGHLRPDPKKLGEITSVAYLTPKGATVYGETIISKLIYLSRGQYTWHRTIDKAYIGLTNKKRGSVIRAPLYKEKSRR